ncbi:MAG: hypothetical protein ABFS18_03280 [Thermodesulfobacteriota bacterium]
MKPTYIYTALIDVLTYRYRLEQDQKNGELTFKEDLQGALSIFDEINGAVFGVQAISDTIIMTCNNHDNFIEFLGVLKSVFIAFLDKGLFIRGGVAYSRHFENGRLTYSHAVARAHELEDKSAIYPRIIIDENIVGMYSSSAELPNLEGQSLLVKQNGVFFLNVVDEGNWEEIYQVTAQIYQRDRDTIVKKEKAFSKHSWFENYLFAMKKQELEKDRYIEQMEIV